MTLSDVCTAFEQTLLPPPASCKGFFSRATYVAGHAVGAALLFVPALLASCFPDPLPSAKTPLKKFAENPEWLSGPTPAPLPVGAASAAFQDRGPSKLPNNTWTDWLERQGLDTSECRLADPDLVVSRLKELGMTSFRFSIDWSQIEPQENRLNRTALEEYRRLLMALDENGIEPMVTLHHFNEPLWFQERGGFMREENIAHFVSFCETVFAELGPWIPSVVTINEPTIYAFQGYVMGAFPPGQLGRFDRAARVLENLFKAHTAVYRAVKAIRPSTRVGIAHDILKFRPKNRWFPLERIFCRYISELTHHAAMRYFKTGEFQLQVPFLANHTYRSERPPLDFIGVQWYSDPVLSFLPPQVGSIGLTPDEPQSQYDFRVAPQDFATALEEAAELEVPIEITEVGTCVDDLKYPTARVDFFERIFQVVKRALAQGISIRSLKVWTLVDNIEWHRLFTVRFGLFGLNERTGEVFMRPVGEWIRDRIREGGLSHAAAAS